MLCLEPTDDEVDHLIQGGAGLVRAFRNQLRMEKTNHRGACAHRSNARIGDMKFAGRDTIRDDLRYYACDAVHMRPADIPILFHGDGDHVVHFRIADVAVCVHPMNGRKKLAQPFGGATRLLSDGLRLPLHLPHESPCDAGVEAV